jgi:xanthine/uracil permease
MIKLFQFRDTINGTNFILRYLLGLVVITVNAGGLGYNMAAERYSLVILFAILMSSGIVINFTTFYKRIKAVYPNHVTESMISLVGFNLTQLLVEDELIKNSVGLLYFIYMLILIFSNSDIKEHRG